MNNLKISIVISYILFFTFSVKCQEYVSPLNFNQAVNKAQKKAIYKHPKPILYNSIPDLPFFDDFSDSLDSPYPKQSLWADKYVFVNATYSSNPPSIGVATFDALDNNGQLYSKALTMTTFSADTLTSKSINLGNLSPQDSIYLSFFYQPQGLGPAPDEKDSLILQLYSPLLKNWKSYWFALGTNSELAINNAPFKLVMCPVADSSLFHDGFRFRFVNYASVNYGPNYPGLSSNGDIWNIDYVYMDKNRNLFDTIFRDAAITQPVGSVLKHYTSMPWKDFKLPSVFQAEMSNKISLTVRNNDYLQRNIDFEFQISEENSKLNPYSFENAIAIKRDTTETISEDLPLDAFTSESDSTTVFKIKAFLNTSADSFDRKVNDTVISYQRFSNYYAYDDGSAEYGYGIMGEGTTGALVAYEFDTEVAGDSLQAVDIYFNRILTYDSIRNFNLMVWADMNGQPGDSISGLMDTFPDKNLEGQYKRYFLPKPILIPDTFYIGWQQTNEVFLNIGFDRNRSSTDKLWLNYGQGWDKSAITTSGALMMRPVVGGWQMAHTNIKQVPIGKIKIYPNPATDFVKIDIPNDPDGSIRTILFYDLTGKIVLNFKGSDQIINISSLKKGFYLIRIQGNSGQVFCAKLVKN